MSELTRESSGEGTLGPDGKMSRVPDLETPANIAERDVGEAVGLRLLAVSPDCIQVVLADGTLHSMNDAGRRVMEIDDFATVAGKRWADFWPETTRAKVDGSVASALGGQIARFSDFCPTAKDTPKWWDVVVSPLAGSDGVVRRLLVVSRDITVQKDYEDRLRQGEQKFRALADNIAQLAWMADAGGRMFWYNHRWFEYTGTTLEDMSGVGWQKTHHPDHVGRVVKGIGEHFVSGEPWEDTFPLKGADGSYRWFLSRAMPIRNEHGRIVLWCGTNTDITDQRETAERLSQKARLIELSHEAIIVWDLVGGIVAWNRGCEELYGYASDDAIGERTHDLLRTRHPIPIDEFEALLRRDKSWSGEVLHIDRNGSEVWVETRQELIDVGDRKLVLETNRDITARRKADEMTQLLLGELDHRVKNTLAIVQSIASQTARRASNLASFTTSFNARLQSLSSAHNLLTATRWSGADLRELIRAQIAESAEQDLQVDLDGPDVFLLPQVALQLSLIIFELASNARKFGAFSRSEGRVWISWTTTDGDKPRLELLWREIGGPPVVEPKTRGFGTTLIERAGSQSHLHAHLQFLPDGLQCRISADIATSANATRAIFNPRRKGRAMDQPAPPSAPEPRRDRVLIIEDEPLIALEIEEFLVERGYRSAGQSASVEDALQALARSPPDVAVVDGSLFGEPVDGILERLGELGVPYVMVTGFSRENLPAVVRDARIPVIRKPIEGEALLEALRDVSSRRRPAG